MTSRRRSIRSIANARRGFSLAELMIALAILGFGLLVIGATLPIGIMKHRETIELAMGDAAVNYALDMLSGRVTLSQSDGGAINPLHESFFRPMAALGTLADDPNVSGRPYEPWIKVRPLIVQNVHVAGNGSPGRGSVMLGDGSDTGWTPTGLVERQIQRLFERLENEQSGLFVAAIAGEEYLPWANCYAEGSQPDETGLLAPVVSALDAVFPAVPLDASVSRTEQDRFTPAFLLSSSNLYDRYATRMPDGGNASLIAGDANAEGSETLKALDERNVCWVAFYRRVSYLAASDESLYEIIVVAVRRTTSLHRFPLPRVELDGWDPRAPLFRRLDDFRNASMIPIPVLVAFSNNSGEFTAPYATLSRSSGDPVGTIEYAIEDSSPNPIVRTVAPGTVEPTTLQFVCTRRVGELLPPGSVFIPAVNDQDLSGATAGSGTLEPDDRQQYSGFVPEASQNLPIYKVLTREYNTETDLYALTVEGNGFYPWVHRENDYSDPPALTDRGACALAWPVWVIPPAFTEVVDDPNLGYRVPLFEKRSPILAVGRRLIRVREVP